MSSTSTRDHQNPPSDITLRLSEIQDLFAPPRRNPFQANYLPTPGIDQIVQALKQVRPRKTIGLTIILPESSTQTPDLPTDVHTAIQRYCDNHIASLTIDLAVRQRDVVRSLQFGVVILGVSLALAAAITSSESIVAWLRTLLANSISIFGSVALWSPTDAFLFGMQPLYNERRLYKVLRDMPVVIQYDKVASSATVHRPY